MKPRSRRLTKGVAIASIAAMAGALGLVATATASNATSTFAFTNIAGPDRYGTAADLAAKTFTGTVTNVLVATAFNFPDALAGNFLAGNEKAPILLVNSSGALPAETQTELAALKPTTITILGGTYAVGADVAAELAALPGVTTVNRIAGPDRDGTAEQVDTASGTTVGTIGGLKTAFLTRDDDFPDALGAGPFAYAKNIPIILTPTAALSAEAASTITTLGIKQLIVLGGTDAVSSATIASANALGAATPASLTFAGSDRSNTSQLLAEWELTQGFSNSSMDVASGDESYGGVDALAAGPFAGTNLTPLLVTDSVSNAGSDVAYATANAGTLTGGYSIGGTNPLPTATLATIVTAAQSTSAIAVTDLPQLVSASIVSTTTAVQANATNVAGTVVQYVFSQSLTGATYAPADFFVFPDDDLLPAPGTGYAGTSVCSVTGTCATSTNADAVNVLFNESALEQTPGSVADSASSLTLATVGTGAVTTTTDLVNPDGNAAIGSTSTVTPVAGVTDAPDITSIGTPRAAATAGYSAIDVTFDKPAYPVTGGAGATNLFSLLLASGNTDGGVFTVGTTNNQEEICASPEASDVGNGTPGTGFTSPNFDAATDSVTIECANPTGSSAMTITPAQIARVIVDPDAVETSAGGGTENTWYEAAPSTSRNSGLQTPDLTSLTLTPGTGTASDVATFTYDEGVTDVNPSLFTLVGSSGTTVPGVGLAGSCTNVTPAAGASGCLVSSTTSSLQVALYFPNGTFKSNGTVEVAVTHGAVEDSGNAAITNGDDELPATNSAATTTSAGSINAVQLASATVSSTTNGLGVATYTATYTFDEAANLGVASNSFHLYDADGVELTCTPAAILATSDTQATCASFAQGNMATGPTSATSAQLAAVVLATVDYDGVTGNTAGAVSPATTAYPNPEGAVVTTS